MSIFVSKAVKMAPLQSKTTKRKRMLGRTQRMRGNLSMNVTTERKRRRRDSKKRIVRSRERSWTSSNSGERKLNVMNIQEASRWISWRVMERKVSTSWNLPGL